MGREGIYVCVRACMCVCVWWCVWVEGVHEGCVRVAQRVRVCARRACGVGVSWVRENESPNAFDPSLCYA